MSDPRTCLQSLKPGHLPPFLFRFPRTLDDGNESASRITSGRSIRVSWGPGWNRWNKSVPVFVPGQAADIIKENAGMERWNAGTVFLPLCVRTRAHTHTNITFHCSSVPIEKNKKAKQWVRLERKLERDCSGCSSPFRVAQSFGYPRGFRRLCGLRPSALRSTSGNSASASKNARAAGGAGYSPVCQPSSVRRGMASPQSRSAARAISARVRLHLSAALRKRAPGVVSVVKGLSSSVVVPGRYRGVMANCTQSLRNYQAEKYAATASYFPVIDWKGITL